MYVAGRSNLRLMGKVYKLGEPVDISGIPLRKVSSFTRLGIIVDQPGTVEVPEAQPELAARVEATATVEGSVDSGDLCPFCGEGPFMNMKIHTSRMHKEEEPNG